MPNHRKMWKQNSRLFEEQNYTEIRFSDSIIPIKETQENIGEWQSWYERSSSETSKCWTQQEEICSET